MGGEVVEDDYVTPGRSDRRRGTRRRRVGEEEEEPRKGKKGKKEPKQKGRGGAWLGGTFSARWSRANLRRPYPVRRR